MSNQQGLTAIPAQLSELYHDTIARLLARYMSATGNWRRGSIESTDPMLLSEASVCVVPPRCLRDAVIVFLPKDARTKKDLLSNGMLRM